MREIVERHIDLLTKGGYLIASILNLRGINHILSLIFHMETISVHNLDIMEKVRFSALFNKERLMTLMCDYFGTFNFGVFNTNKDFPMRIILDLCNKVQLILNMIFRNVLKDDGAESKLFSPYLIYIGLKKA